ncbi:MAG: hypothetical protein VYC88_06050 [SAR324 cluster bacterium]|nr:hypothetical protein [SAR324 cluster bacterium]
MLSYVPFRRFRGFWRILAVLGGLGLDSCVLGPSGLEYTLLGWIWGLPSWNLAFGGLLRLNLNSCCFLGLFVFCCTVAAYLPTNLFTLSVRRLMNIGSCHARRSISHKEIPQRKSKRQINKQMNERTNERTGEKQTSTQTSKQQKNERENERTNRQTD